LGESGIFTSADPSTHSIYSDGGRESLIPMISATTSQPQALLSAIYKAIDDGRVVTWRYVTHDGVTYLTHSPPQWNGKAFLKPAIGTGALLFNILKPSDDVVTPEIYGVYHGRFIEMLLAHFDTQFSLASATAQPVSGDCAKTVPQKSAAYRY
jgi:hypothetical protein